MAKYIDCEALKQILLEKGFYPAIVKSAIEEAPGVEIVRCKECRHYDIRNAKCLLHSERADQYSSGYDFEMYSRDFCSYGERKDGDV